MSTPLELIENHRESAEVYTDLEMCKKKTAELLEEIHMPSGLLPLKDIVEVGRHRETGFVWLKQKEATTHTFEKIGKKVWYDLVVTATVEDRKMNNVTGVQSKEMLIWVTLTHIRISSSDPKKIVFATPAGLSRSYAVSAFEEEKEKEESKK